MSPLFSPAAQRLGALMESVRVSLLQPDAQQTEAACKALLEGLTKLLSGYTPESVQALIRADEMVALGQQLAQLRQQLAQASSANARQLAVLLPEQLPGAYSARGAAFAAMPTGVGRRYLA